jgi:hypothetical protein
MKKCHNCGKSTMRVRICQKCGFSGCPSCNPSSGTCSSCKKSSAINEMRV